MLSKSSVAYTYTHTPGCPCAYSFSTPTQQTHTTHLQLCLVDASHQGLQSQSKHIESSLVDVGSGLNSSLAGLLNMGAKGLCRWCDGVVDEGTTLGEGWQGGSQDLCVQGCGQQ